MTTTNPSMEAAVAAAARVANARNATRAAIGLSTDQTINMACAVVALDVAVSLAAGLLQALDAVRDEDLPVDVVAALHGLTNALVAIGYATLRTEEKTDGNDD